MQECFDAQESDGYMEPLARVPVSSREVALKGRRGSQQMRSGADAW